MQEGGGWGMGHRTVHHTMSTHRHAPNRPSQIKGQTHERMGQFLRHTWHSMVDRVEWDRYRNAAAGLKNVADLPTTASGVLKWWQEDLVRNAFPTLSAFICQVIAMLPREGEDRCGGGGGGRGGGGVRHEPRITKPLPQIIRILTRIRTRLPEILTRNPQILTRNYQNSYQKSYQNLSALYQKSPDF